MLQRFVPGVRGIETIIKVIAVPKVLDGATISVAMDGDNKRALVISSRAPTQKPTNDLRKPLIIYHLIKP